MNAEPYTIDAQKPISSVQSIFFLSMLGTPLAGLYLIKKNFENFGQKERGDKVFRSGILLGVFCFILGSWVVMFIGLNLFKLFFTVVMSFVLRQYTIRSQQYWIVQHRGQGGKEPELGYLVTAGIVVFALMMLVETFVMGGLIFFLWGGFS